MLVTFTKLHHHVNPVCLFRVNLEHHILLRFDVDPLRIISKGDQDLFIECEFQTLLIFDKSILNELLMHEKSIVAHRSILILVDRDS